MSDIAIRAENLSKSYQITHSNGRGGYKTLQEEMVRLLKRPFSKNERASHRETFWALKDVSFEVRHGEVLGIIGRNGAGKSTLLKILSRITKPTTGHADIYGRIGSLLEVGTGFHPELTGRENVFLNGAVLGMSRRDILKHFDEIVAFAEVEQFLDTPVKRYSSGMYMRLAFAVAAHLEPEVLVVDEVLAVGDAAFQKKCLGKMEDVAKSGRTVLFVSHNMSAISQLCSSCVLLVGGKVQELGNTNEVIQSYLNQNVQEESFIDLSNYSPRIGTGLVSFQWAKLENKNGRVCQDFSIGDDIRVVFALRIPPNCSDLKIALEMRSIDGIPLANMIDIDSGFKLSPAEGIHVVSVVLSDIRLYPSSYFLSLWVSSTFDDIPFDYVKDCISFHIIGGGQLTMRPLPRHAGLLFLTPEWKLEEMSDALS